MDSLFRWALLFVVALGAPFSAIGLWEGYKTYSQLQRSERTRGAITANHLLVDRRDGHDEQAYRAEVSFQTARGELVHFTDSAGSLPADYAVGARVEVAYEPDAPEHARLISWKRLWLVPTLLTLVGALPALVAGALLFKLGRAAR